MVLLHLDRLEYRHHCVHKCYLCKSVHTILKVHKPNNQQFGYKHPHILVCCYPQIDQCHIDSHTYWFFYLQINSDLLGISIHISLLNRPCSKHHCILVRIFCQQDGHKLLLDISQYKHYCNQTKMEKMDIMLKYMTLLLGQLKLHQDKFIHIENLMC